MLLLFIPEPCREVGTAISAAVGRACSHPVSPSSSKDDLFCTHPQPCLCSSHPGFPGFRNGRRRQQCLCYAAAPAACSSGEQQRVGPGLGASLELQDAFSRRSDLPLPSGCHCPESKHDASLVPFCKHCNRDDNRFLPFRDSPRQRAYSVTKNE